MKSGQLDNEDSIIMAERLSVMQQAGDDDNDNCNTNNAEGGEGGNTAKVEDYDDDDKDVNTNAKHTGGSGSGWKNPPPQDNGGFPSSSYVFVVIS
jgi:hypothetical protein